jgi:hypothetical protein
MGRTAAIEWKDTEGYVNGKMVANTCPVAGLYEPAVMFGEKFLKKFAPVLTLEGAKTWCDETYAQFCSVNQQEQPTEPLLTWIDGEGFLDGVLRAWVRQPSTVMATVGTYYLNNTPRQNPLVVAQVFGNKVGCVEQAHCLTEDDAKRWCERVIREEKKP